MMIHCIIAQQRPPSSLCTAFDLVGDARATSRAADDVHARVLLDLHRVAPCRLRCVLAADGNGLGEGGSVGRGCVVGLERGAGVNLNNRQRGPELEEISRTYGGSGTRVGKAKGRGEGEPDDGAGTVSARYGVQEGRTGWARARAGPGRCEGRPWERMERVAGNFPLKNRG